jgi:hypothetical protein
VPIAMKPGVLADVYEMFSLLVDFTRFLSHTDFGFRPRHFA